MRKFLTTAGRKPHVYHLARLRRFSCSLVIFSLIFLLISGSVWAQGQRVIRGKVTNENNEPLQGASVVLKGNSLGTSTDASGKYEIRIPEKGGTLVITYVGLNTLEVPVTSKNTVDVQLIAASSSLKDVVVVGYGTQRKATLTGAISSIKGEDIITTKNENVQNMLTGKIAGVRVTQRTAEPGAFNNNFDIRGMGLHWSLLMAFPVRLMICNALIQMISITCLY